MSRDPNSPGPLIEPLTRREREILILLEQDLSNQEIAQKLSLAVSSTKWHISQIYSKLGVNSRRQALARARELGLLHPTTPAPPISSMPEPRPGQLLPTGTVTFLFTDIEGSTSLWERQPQQMSAALLLHNAALRQAIENYRGIVFKTIGDAFQAAFPTAPQALQAALAGQRALQAAPWNELGPLKVRMGLHTGEADLDPGGDEYAVSHTKNRVARIMSAAHAGQVLLSAETAELVNHQLPPGVSLKDLGEHRLKGMVILERLFQALAPGLREDFPPLVSQPGLKPNLPPQRTGFIGREAEIHQVKILLKEHALVTLTGPGGVGKTRLALRAAEEFLSTYTHGVWLVELAPLADPSLVPQAVAAVFNLQENPGQDFTGALLDYLREKHLLLILDNCEHLVGTCARLAETLMLSCPGLSILATSREALGLDGERIYPVPSLPSPDPERLPPLEKLSEYAAVSLFVERATAASPGFCFTEETAAQIAQVCRRLDGIPLAIELAASRLRVLDVGQIAARLEDRFRLLAGGSRTALPKNQTVRASIDWSYNLLSDAERALLQRLSVYAGGWILEAAEAICADPKGEGGRNRDENILSIAPSNVLELLASLVNKSLVIVERKTKGAPRYRLLESIREYSVELLEDNGAGEAFRKRHATYYLGLVEEADLGMRRAEASAWLDRLDNDYANIRAALSWSLAGGAVEAGLKAAPCLTLYWFRRSNLGEGRAWLHRALAQTGENDCTHVRADLLNASGTIAWFLGDLENAQIQLEDSLALCTELGYRHGLAMANLWLFLTAARQGQGSEVWMPLAERSLALFRAPSDEWWLGFSLLCVGDTLTSGGDVQKGLPLLKEAEKLFRQLGDTYGLSYLLGMYGKLDWKLGDIQTARKRYREGLALKRQFGDRWGTAQLLHEFGSMEVENAKEVGDFQRGEAILEESLALLRDLGSRAAEVLWVLNALGRAAKGQGHHLRAMERFKESLAFGQQNLMQNLNEITGLLFGPMEYAVDLGHLALAARLLGAIEAGFTSTPMAPDNLANLERCTAAVRAHMDEADFTAARAEGRALTLEQAVALAMDAQLDIE